MSLTDALAAWLGCIVVTAVPGPPVSVLVLRYRRLTWRGHPMRWWQRGIVGAILGGYLVLISLGPVWLLAVGLFGGIAGALGGYLWWVSRPGRVTS